MLQQIKDNMFTIHGIITTLLHLFLTIGLVLSVATFKIFVLGQDPTGYFHSQPPPQEDKEDKPPAKGKGK